MTGLPITAVSAIGLVSKATVVLSVALVLAWFARRGSARTLHLLWKTTFAVLLVLPVLSLVAPIVGLPILPRRTTAIGTISQKTSDRPVSDGQARPARWRQPDPVHRVPDRFVRPPLGATFNSADSRRWCITHLGTRLRGWAHFPRRRRPAVPKARAGGNPDSRPGLDSVDSWAPAPDRRACRRQYPVQCPSRHTHDGRSVEARGSTSRIGG